MDKEEKTRILMSCLLVTIDGPAGSGKSTTAKMLAGELGLTYLDTGAMYRAVTYSVLKKGIDPDDEPAVTETAEKADIELKEINGRQVIHLDGEEVESKIRGTEVSEAVSPVSRHIGVRRAMVRIQRRIGTGGGIVAEGRDTGSTVFPFADLKVFLIADIETRAKRRVAQMRELGIEEDIVRIRENITSRDRIDSGRQHSPLLRAPGSFVVDTSDITIQQQVGMIADRARGTAAILAELKVWPGEKNEFEIFPFWWKASRAIVYSFFKVLFGLKIRGLENLACRENFLVASNHISYADPPLAGCAVNRFVFYMAKRELFGKPFIGWLISHFNAIPVSRGEADRKSIREISSKLESGHSVILYPEGTRSRTGEIGRMKSGIGMIAMRTGTTILPVFLSGANRLKECFLRRCRLTVTVGRPIRIDASYESEDRKKDYSTLTSMVREELSRLRDEAKT